MCSGNNIGMKMGGARWVGLVILQLIAHGRIMKCVSRRCVNNSPRPCGCSRLVSGAVELVRPPLVLPDKTV